MSGHEYITQKKVIDPLAVHFTQHHIRTTFRKGELVEPVIDEIESLPGTGDYDIFLRAPFPTIEIIRWSPPAHMRTESNCWHWYTLDNRRLYCLQRAAVALLPKRVGVVVKVRCEDFGNVKRKFDSVSLGRSVTVAHSSKEAPLFTWNWRDWGCAPLHYLQDDQKHTLDSLQVPPDDMVGPGDSVSDALKRAEECLARMSVNHLTIAKPQDSSQCSTPSTEDDDSSASSESSPSSGSKPLPPSSSSDLLSQVSTADLESEVMADPTSGVLDRVSQLKSLERHAWKGHGAERYDVNFAGESIWLCFVKGKGSSNMTSMMTYDEQWDVVWWETDQVFYFHVGEYLAKGSEEITWYSGYDWEMAKPCFKWDRCCPEAQRSARDSADSRHAGRKHLTDSRQKPRQEWRPVTSQQKS